MDDEKTRKDMPKKEKKKAQNFSRADSAQYLFIFVNLSSEMLYIFS
jgi:hypothetical protein